MDPGGEAFQWLDFPVRAGTLVKIFLFPPWAVHYLNCAGVFGSLIFSCLLLFSFSLSVP